MLDNWLYLGIVMAAFAAGIYLLYRHGLLSTKQIRAISFVFQPRRNGDRFTLDACTGWVRHVVRFRESRTYRLTLDARLSRGEAELSLLDGQKRQLLKLNRQSSTGTIQLDSKSMYYLYWTFQDAAGRCALHW